MYDNSAARTAAVIVPLTDPAYQLVRGILRNTIITKPTGSSFHLEGALSQIMETAGALFESTSPSSAMAAQWETVYDQEHVLALLNEMYWDFNSEYVHLLRQQIITTDFGAWDLVSALSLICKELFLIYLTHYGYADLTYVKFTDMPGSVMMCLRERVSE